MPKRTKNFEDIWAPGYGETVERRLTILRDLDNYPRLLDVMEKYNVSQMSIWRWRKRLEEAGLDWR